MEKGILTMLKECLIRYKNCTEPTCSFCEDDVRQTCNEIRDALDVAPADLRKILGWRHIGRPANEEQTVKKERRQTHDS